MMHVMKQKQNIIFCCGPDMCGKTQIAKELSRRLNIPYFKAKSEHSSAISDSHIRSSLDYGFANQKFLQQLLIADPRTLDLFTQCGYSIIADRNYPCEWVYSKAFCRPTDPIALDFLDESYAKLGAKIIIAYRSSYKGLTDDLDPRIDSQKLVKLDALYREFANWTQCETLFLNVDDEDLNREVVEIIQWLDG